MQRKKIWLDYDQNDLDAQYDNQRTVADYDAIMREWAQASANARAISEVKADLIYEAHPRARIDFYPAKRGGPAMIFFHGGFWRSFDKTGLAFLAPAFTSAGISIAFPNYPLAPEASLATIVQHACRSVSWVIDHVEELHIDRANIWLAGHSAGAHLAVMAAGAAPEEFDLRGCCAISGIYDLQPIRLSYLNKTLHLSEVEVVACSPINLKPKVPCLITAVGEKETDEFRRQTGGLTALARTSGCVLQDNLLPDTDHYEAVRTLARPNDPFFEQIASVILSDKASA